MNNDKLHSINAQAAVTSAYTAISSIQHLSAEEQLSGIAVLIHSMALNTNQDISYLMSMAERIAKDADSNYTTAIRALRHYVRDNLRG